MKYVLIVCCIISIQASAQSGKFNVKGDLHRSSNKVKYVYYSYNTDGKTVEDSALVKKNKYNLSGIIHEPSRLVLKARYHDTSLKSDYRKDHKMLYISAGDKVNILHADSFSIAEVKGSLAQQEFLKLEDAANVYLKQINNSWKEIEDYKVKNDTLNINKRLAVIKELANSWKKVYTDYVYQNPSSPMALYAIKQYSGPFIEFNEIEPLYTVLSQQIKNQPAGKELYRRLEIARRTAIGKAAPNITQKDTLRNAVSLSDFKGKYVLLEFWASWCRPCREENPKLVKTYNIYRQKGFEILGISVDENRKSWLNAIKKDGLTWLNAADLLDTDKNPAALTYGVQAIPNNFLIDPEGKIIGKNLRGDELGHKLEELLGKR